MRKSNKLRLKQFAHNLTADHIGYTVEKEVDMDFIYGVLTAWILISWIFFILSEIGCIDVFTEDKPLWFLFAPMWILVIFILPISIYREKHYVLSRMKFEELKKCNFLYKKIWKNLYLCRYYGNKEKHPFLYHLMIPMYIKIKD